MRPEPRRGSLMRPIHLLSCLFLAPLVCVGATTRSEAGELRATEDLTAVEAKGRLATLKRVLRSRRATTLEIRSALSEVAEAYGSVGEDARARDAFRKQADPLFVKALVRWKSPRGTTTGNLHETNCIHAAHLIGQVALSLDAKARRSLSRRVQSAIGGTLLKHHEPEDISQTQLDASFAAVADISAPTALDWYLKEFMHTKIGELRVLAAAHKSLVLFRDVPGVRRRAVVKAIIDRYAGVESRAHHGHSVSERAAKRFWDEMKLYTIPALQHFAGGPTNDKDEALATVKAFQAWWRDHKKTSDAIWRD